MMRADCLIWKFDNLKMMLHQQLELSELHSLIRTRRITLAGNRKLKIYGTLQCKSGKRMKKENRIFFGGEGKAITIGFRPCGHCMAIAYKRWKQSKKQVEIY